MSYRKIIVDDKEYEYVIGHTALKVKGIEVLKLKDDMYEQIFPSDVKRLIQSHNANKGNTNEN